MIRVGISGSSKLDDQIELLKHYPEIVVKHYRPALVSATQTLERNIRPNIPVGFSGVLSDTFMSKVSGKQITSIKGIVGWDNKTPYYAHFAEGGAVGHEILPNEKVSYSGFRTGKGRPKSLRWMEGGKFFFSKSVNHPGAPARKFMANGWSQTGTVVNGMMSRAGEAIVNELAIK